MKANQDKHLEEIVDKLMKEDSLEKPSSNFTAGVMLQILAADTSTATLYKPLISKKAWFIIFGSIISLVVYLVMSGNTQAGSWLDLFYFSEINKSIIKSFTGFKFSAITIYTVVVSTVMLFIQITYLKNYFNKRFES